MNVIENLRAADARVDVVVNAFVAQRLGVSLDDLTDDLVNHIRGELLSQMIAGQYVVGAARLLEHLDAVVARQHPVDVDHHETYAVANVSLDDDTVLHAKLKYDGLITLDHDPCRRELGLDDAEHLAYALLRLVDVGRRI